MSKDFSISSELSPFNLPQLRCTDKRLLDHWMTVTLPHSCLDPTALHQLRGMYLSLICHRKRVALHAILAASAAHMLSLGVTEEHTLVMAKQRSLNSMIVELNTLAETKNTCANFDAAHSRDVHSPCPVVEDASIVASMLLLGPEFINAGDEQGPRQVRSLLQGARTLIVERHGYFSCRCHLTHPARYEPQFRPDSPVFISSVRSLAFTDIMTCVPCVRKPYIGKRYWLEAAMTDTNEGLRKRKPDPDLGYSAWTLSLLGDCAALIEDLYTEAVSQPVFSARQEELLLQLKKTTLEMQQFQIDAEDENPVMALPEAQTTMLAHKHNIAATICHAISAQIFLLRATDFGTKSPCVVRLCHALYHVLSAIPMDHSAATMMLWPLWVLGCETYPSTTYPSRSDIMAMLQRLYESQHMKNVEQCFVKLRRDIWKEDHSHTKNLENKRFEVKSQCDWVKRCWEEKIELLLA